MAKGKATIESVAGGEPETVDIDDLLAVRRFGEPIYPGLVHVDSVWRGNDAAPHHVVINGENFHAVQILGLTHERSVDVLYLDPPYNTGARDWKYNNRIVGDDDAYSDSKWLSMMERRLEKAKRLKRVGASNRYTVYRVRNPGPRSRPWSSSLPLGRLGSDEPS